MHDPIDLVEGEPPAEKLFPRKMGTLKLCTLDIL
jgi:hypothetical protein